MDAVKFLHTYLRMCRFYDGCKKKGCPLEDMPTCNLYDSEMNVKEAVEATEKWGEEHPEKTMAQDFFEKHPNALRNEDGTPRVCPMYCGYFEGEDCPFYDDDSDDRCANCWNRPLEEV